MNSKIKAVFAEILKWGIVIFGLWPVMFSDLPRRSDLPLVLLGVVALVIIIGKMFYDALMDRSRDRSNNWDLLRVLGVVILIAVLIGGAMLFLIHYISLSMQNMNE
mgnify:CR=1 FL=1